MKYAENPAVKGEDNTKAATPPTAGVGGARSATVAPVAGEVVRFKLR